MEHIYSALEIANYFLFKAAKDEELLSNLKVQKLIYYAQGIHLAIYGTPIFKEPIVAWAYGPVVRGLYSIYKKYGAGGILPDESFNPKSIDKETREYLDEIYTAFGQFSATRLMDFTHTDQCWKDAWKDTNPNKIITHKSMQESLKKYLKSDKKT
jgi:uncharacterized phage-associated protein